jgi:hypothetical protein
MLFLLVLALIDDAPAATVINTTTSFSANPFSSAYSPAPICLSIEPWDRRTSWDSMCPSGGSVAGFPFPDFRRQTP